MLGETDEEVRKVQNSEQIGPTAIHQGKKKEVQNTEKNFALLRWIHRNSVRKKKKKTLPHH